MAEPTDADPFDKAASPSPPSEKPAQDFLDEAPPFWSWRAIYLLVAGALAVQIVVYALLSRVTS